MKKYNLENSTSYQECKELLKNYSVNLTKLEGKLQLSFKNESILFHASDNVEIDETDTELTIYINENKIYTV